VHTVAATLYKSIIIRNTAIKNAANMHTKSSKNSMHAENISKSDRKSISQTHHSEQELATSQSMQNRTMTRNMRGYKGRNGI